MGFDVERITCGAFSSSSKGASSRLHSPSLVQRSGGPLQDLSKTTGWRSSCRLALSRETPLTTGWRSSRLVGTQKAEGSVALPSGADPRTGQRAPTQGPTLSNAKRVSALVSCLLSVLACRVGASLVPGRCFSGPAPAGSCLFFAPPPVSFLWPRASRSGSRREGRRVKSLFFSFRATSQEPFSSREETLLPARRQNPPELPLRLMRRWP